MFGRIRRRLTYANVIATLALFIAVGTGGAFAAATITGADIVDGSITGVDLANRTLDASKLTAFAVTNGRLANDAVTGAKVLDGSLTGADIDQSTLTDVMQGQSLFTREVIPMSGALFFPGGIPDLFFVGATCSASSPALTFDNETEETMDVVHVDSSSTTGGYQQLGPASGPNFRLIVSLPTSPNVQEFHISTPSGRSASVWVASAPRPATSDCLETVHAVATK